MAGASDGPALLQVLRAANVPRGGSGRPTWGERFDDVQADLAVGRYLLARVDGVAVGCLSLSWSDEMIWGPDDATAGYVHRLAVRADWTGRHLGARLLDTAGERVAERGRSWLRLDCEPEATGLCAFYERCGFLHVRDITAVPRTTRPGARRASLYQRPAVR